MGKPQLTLVISIIIAVIVIFSFIAGSTTTMTDSSDTITTANNCSQFEDPSTGIPYVYNSTSGSCHNTTGLGSDVVTAAARLKTLPLNSLFASNGVVWLILMAMVLLVIAGFVLLKKRK